MRIKLIKFDFSNLEYIKQLFKKDLLIDLFYGIIFLIILYFFPF